MDMSHVKDITEVPVTLFLIREDIAEESTDEAKLNEGGFLCPPFKNRAWFT